jgi:hypothetical protein
LRREGVPPSLNAAPPLLVARHEEALDTSTVGLAAVPAVVTLAATSPESASLFPDLRGLSAREAARSLARLGLGATLHGVGLVIAQRPDPGTPIERGASGTLWLERQVFPRLVSDTAP